MQTIKINQQRKPIAFLLALTMIASLMLQLIDPISVQAEELSETRTINIETQYEKAMINSDNPPEVITTTHEIIGQGTFVVRGWYKHYTEDANYSFLYSYVFSNMGFTLNGNNAIKYNGVYYYSLISGYGGINFTPINVPNCAQVSEIIDVKKFIDSGALDLTKDNYKEVNYSETEHDFTHDTYSADIPTPILSNFTHNGFKVSNIDGYYIDVYVKSQLYGVKLEKITGSWVPTVNTDWIYKQHMYNFADMSDIAVNNENINIKELWSIDNESKLIEDFKAWSYVYNDVARLPDYTFLKGGTACDIAYDLRHNYNTCIGTTELEKLQNSTQACTVFYVRFYDKDMNYGRWIKYTYKDGAKTVGASVITQQIAHDDNGNEIIVEEIEGKQDYENGLIDYTDNNSIDFDMNLADVEQVLNSITNIFNSCKEMLASYVNLLSACFPFFPDGTMEILLVSLVVMCFIGIIKAVKS